MLIHERLTPAIGREIEQWHCLKQQNRAVIRLKGLPIREHSLVRQSKTNKLTRIKHMVADHYHTKLKISNTHPKSQTRTWPHPPSPTPSQLLGCTSESGFSSNQPEPEPSWKDRAAPASRPLFLQDVKLACKCSTPQQQTSKKLAQLNETMLCVFVCVWMDGYIKGSFGMYI